MRITKEILASKILKYLNRQISSDDFAIWAENAMLENDYQDEYFDEISNALSKIGLINVENFKLPIAFYLNTLKNIDYKTIFGLEPDSVKSNEFEYS